MKNNIPDVVVFAVKRLKYIRESVLNMSLADVADELGTGRSFISNTENLRYEPRISTLLMLCDVYGIGFEELFTGYSARNYWDIPFFGIGFEPESSGVRRKRKSKAQNITAEEASVS